MQLMRIRASQKSDAKRRAFAAIFTSFVLHGAFGGALALEGRALLSSAETDSGSSLWTGSTFDVDVEQSPKNLSAPLGQPAQSEAGEDTSEQETEPSPIAPSTKTTEPKVATEKAPDPTVKVPSSTRVATKPPASAGAGGESRDSAAAGSVSGAYGGEGALARKGRFPDSFTRVLPAAAQSLAGVHQLPLGTVERVLLRVGIDGDGAAPKLVASGTVGPVVQSILRRAELLLRGGRFAPPPGTTGEYRLGLEVRIEMGPLDGEPTTAPEVRQLSSKYPQEKEPGEAFVRFNTGRKLVFFVYVDPDPKRW